MIRFDATTLRRLAAPAAIATVLIGLGVAALAATDRFADEARKAFEGARTERAGIQSRLSRATEDEREIRARLVDYQSLRDRGILGDERRLDWVEAIKSIKTERRLYDVKYSIEPRRPIDYPSFTQTPGVEVMMSRMRIETALLHEEDLLVLLADLKARMSPLVVVRSCGLTRVPGASVAGGAGPRLRGDCLVDLVTIRDSQEAR
ncbi:MAG: hypothetical protein ABIU95_13755 [Burkholderiales bacterium]